MIKSPIGIFDSGYGGLTIFKEIVNQLPEYDYIYLGDNARAPYGTKDFETIYQYTLQAVKWFFDQGCPLVILACNTASAKALRTIQQQDLPKYWPDRKVLGVIRPTTEHMGEWTHSNHIGILGTSGTVKSNSYKIEIERFFPGLKVYQQACPMLVPLIENQEQDSPAMQLFISQYIQTLFKQSAKIDTVVLACTHYPIIEKQLAAEIGSKARLISQGPVVAHALKRYLHKHPEIAQNCILNRETRFFTTEEPELFNSMAACFLNRTVSATQVQLTFNPLNSKNAH